MTSADSICSMQSWKCLPNSTGLRSRTPATLKQVRQSRQYPIWRVAHPFVAGFAVRLIVWFPPSNHAVVALFATDKANMGDVFYDSVGTRADAAIEAWKFQLKQETRHDE